MIRRYCEKCGQYRALLSSPFCFACTMRSAEFMEMDAPHPCMRCGEKLVASYRMYCKMCRVEEIAKWRKHEESTEKEEMRNRLNALEDRLAKLENSQ